MKIATGSPTTPVSTRPALAVLLARGRRTLVGQAVDLTMLAGLGLGYVATGVLAEDHDDWILDGLTRNRLRSNRRKIQHLAAKMERTLGSGAGRDWLATARDFYRLPVEAFWGRVRGLRPRGWRVRTRLQGLPHLRRSIARGRGTVLWRMMFCDTSIAKAALWETGIPLIHLSRTSHGAAGRGWISRGVLAPLWRRAEDAYLAERIILPSLRSPGGMKTLLARLRANGVVSVFGEFHGSQNVTTPFFQGLASFATGSPALAWRTGAALLPVHVVRERRACYRVVIGEPIEPSRGAGRRPYAKEAIGEFSRRLQGAIREYPASWRRWLSASL